MLYGEMMMADPAFGQPLKDVTHYSEALKTRQISENTWDGLYYAPLIIENQ